MLSLLNGLLARYLAIDIGSSIPPSQLAGIQKMTAKVAADVQDKKVDAKDQQSFTELQTQLDTTIGTKDFSNLSTEVRSELKAAKKILGDIQAQGGKVTPEQVAQLKDLSEKILVSLQPPDTEVKWGDLNVKIKDDDTRYQDMQKNKSTYLLPEGGMSVGGVAKTKLSDGTVVPTLKSAIYEDFATVRGKFKTPQDLQIGIENGFGKKLSDEDAKALFDFIEKGSIGGGDKVTEADVGKLQKILGSISPHFEQRLAKNGLYDSKYGYATTEEVRLLAAQMAKTNDADVDKWVPKKDSTYVVDISGSMSEKLKSMYGQIDKCQKLPAGTTKKNQVGTFGEGESKISMGGNTLAQGTIDAALSKSFDLLVGKKPPTPNPADKKAVAEYPQKLALYQEKLADFAKLMHVDLKALTDCTTPNGGLNSGKFRGLMKDDFADKQEAGLKAALVNLMLNEGKTQGRDMYIVTDEPEHEPEYLALVQKLAQEKGINVNIIALPTSPPVNEKTMKFINLKDLDAEAVRKASASGEYNWITAQKTM